MVLINLPWFPWNDAQKKRNQAIFTHLLADSDLFQSGLYVNPPLTFMDHKRWREAPVFSPRKAGTRSFEIVQPFISVPFSYRPVIRELAASAWARYIRRHIKGQPYLLWMNHCDGPSYHLAKALLPSAARSVFDLSDDFTNYYGDAEKILANMKDLAARTDKLLGVNEHVIELVPHPDKKVFPNGTDYDVFQARNPAYANPPHWPKPAGDRYIGFSGGLSRGKTDVELLDKLFRAFPSEKFLFVGFVDDPSLKHHIESFPNTRCVPAVPYHDLPHVIRSFDVAIIPHQINQRTKGNDLLKLMDYLAVGPPVVATPCSGLQHHADLVNLASTHEEFVQKVKRVLESPRPHDAEPGKRFARSRSWREAVPKLAPWIMAPAQKRAIAKTAT